MYFDAEILPEGQSNYWHLLPLLVHALNNYIYMICIINNIFEGKFKMNNYCICLIRGIYFLPTPMIANCSTLELELSYCYTYSKI